MMEEDRRKAEIDEERRLEAAREVALAGGTKAIAANPEAFKGVDPGLLRLYAQLGDLQQKKVADEEHLTQLTDPKALANLGMQLAPTIGPDGQQVDPTPEAKTNVGSELARRTIELERLGRGSLIPNMMSSVGGQATLLAQGNLEQLSQEGRAQRAQLEAEKRQRADEIAREGRARGRNLQDDRVSRAAEVYASGDNAAWQRVVDASDMTNEEYRRVIAEGEAIRAKENRARLTAAGGPTDQQARAQAVARLRAAAGTTYPGAADDAALIEVANMGFRDPLTGGIVISRDKGLQQRRLRLATVKPLLMDFEDAIEGIGAEIASGKVVTAGGLMGSQTANDAARALGLQSRSVSRAHMIQQQLLLTLARMDQSAQMSDFDLKRWIGALPGLQDISFNADGTLNDQAVGRFDGVYQLYEREAKYGLGVLPPTDQIQLENLDADPRGKTIRRLLPPRGATEEQIQEFARDAAIILNNPAYKAETDPAVRARGIVDEIVGPAAR